MAEEIRNGGKIVANKVADELTGRPQKTLRRGKRAIEVVSASI